MTTSSKQGHSLALLESAQIKTKTNNTCVFHTLKNLKVSRLTKQERKKKRSDTDIYKLVVIDMNRFRKKDQILALITRNGGRRNK